MPDWLNSRLPLDQSVPLEDALARLAAAAVLSLVVAWVCRAARRGAGVPPGFVTTMVLLTLLIALVVLAIGNSLARAFSLVGALSIVRFRTVVEDTRDTAFVIFAVTIGLAAGAGQGLLAIIGTAVVGTAALLLRSGRGEAPAAGWVLSLRLGLGQDVQGVVRTVLEKHVESSELLSAVTARQGAALELSYRVALRPSVDTPALVGELNRLDGVQGVELRRR